MSHWFNVGCKNRKKLKYFPWPLYGGTSFYVVACVDVIGERAPFSLVWILMFGFNFDVTA